MERPWLRAAGAVVGGLLLAVPMLVARELGWHLSGGRQLEDPSTRARARVTVVTLDALTGAPLQGIRTWDEGTDVAARTNGSGETTLDLPTGVTLLVAGGRGRAMWGRAVELAAGDSVQVFRLLELEKLAGRVELPDGGPAVGVAVSATPLEWPALPVDTPPTDEEGHFLVPRAVPGSYKVEASLEGMGRAVALVRAPDEELLLRLTGEPLPVLPGGEEPASETLPALAGGIQVTVRGPDGGTVPGALVVAAPVDGGAPGALLRRGQLAALCATDLGGQCRIPADAGCMLASAAPHADSEVGCAGETLLLRPGLQLAGDTRHPGAAGGWVGAAVGPLSAVDRAGRFLLRGLPPGPHELALHDAQGRLLARARVTLPAEGEWTWPEALADAGSYVEPAEAR